jgi:hypothetical protein
LVRTVVSHYLKKESWKDAFKNALLVTGLSLVGGALTKGLFSYFKGGGFIDGVKSYFVGTGVEDQATPVSPGFVKVSEADVTKLMVSDRRGGDEKLLAFIYKTPALLKAFKQEATENSFTDIKTFIRLQDRDELAYIINNAGGMPKEALTLVAQSGIPTNVANKVDPVKAVKATNANVATTGITDYTSKPLKEIGKLALQGDAKATDAYLEKFMKSGPLGLDQYRIMVKAHDAGIIDKNQFFSGVGPRSLNLNAELRGHIPIKINGISVIDKLTPQEAKTAYDAMSVAKMMGNAVDEDTLAKLATKAGKSVATTVKESTYMSLVKKLYI